MKQRPLLLTIMLAGFLSSSLAMAGSMYRWTDDQGNVHYGQNPPRNVESEEIRAHSPAPGGQERRPERPTMDDDDEVPGAATGEGEEETASGDTDPGEQYCEQHRQNLEQLRTRTVVREEDPETGEQRVLDADEREAMIRETEEALEACD